MPSKRKLLWQLFSSYLVITLLSLLLTVLYAFEVVKHVTRQEAVSKLKSTAYLMLELVGDRFSQDHRGEVDNLCKTIGEKIGLRVTVLLPSGSVLGDSLLDPARMDNHAYRPEIREALAGKEGITERQSFALNRTMIFLALPARVDSRIVGVVRTAISVEHVWGTLRPTYVKLGLVTVGIVFLATLLSLYVSYRINRPLAALQEGALRFAQGELDYRLPVEGAREMKSLTDALHAMASQLHERLMTVTRQRNELEAVLFSMVEAVVLVNPDERLLRLNRAAKILLHVKVPDYEGRSMVEVIRNPDLQDFVRRTLTSKEPIETRISVVGDPVRVMQAHGTTVVDAQQQVVGALVVLNDVTRLENLERIRRDFVANVSHELKTPITSIKGFLETLKDGAIHEPNSAEAFVDILIRQTDRLALIIDDLLNLSRIERDAEKGEIKLEEQPIEPVLDAVHRSWEPKAQEKGIRLTFQNEQGLTANMHAQLIEQALGNLVDNAIKYSDTGSTVLVEAKKEGTEIVLRVTDHGCGIPKEHLDRIFERFYRVDKGRSRKEGGTGLGLSIVKHIASAHQGRIEVKSSPGEGSEFTMYLPAPRT